MLGSRICPQSTLGHITHPQSALLSSNQVQSHLQRILNASVPKTNATALVALHCLYQKPVSGQVTTQQQRHCIANTEIYTPSAHSVWLVVVYTLHGQSPACTALLTQPFLPRQLALRGIRRAGHKLKLPSVPAIFITMLVGLPFYPSLHFIYHLKTAQHPAWSPWLR